WSPPPSRVFRTRGASRARGRWRDRPGRWSRRRCRHAARREWGSRRSLFAFLLVLGPRLRRLARAALTRLQLGQARLQLLVLALQPVEVLAQRVGRTLGLTEIAHDLTDATPHARVQIRLEAVTQCAASLGVTELAERAHRVDPEDGIAVLEELLDGLARLAVAGELGQSHD